MDYVLFSNLIRPYLGKYIYIDRCDTLWKRCKKYCILKAIFQQTSKVSAITGIHANFIALFFLIYLGSQIQLVH